MLKLNDLTDLHLFQLEIKNQVQEIKFLDATYSKTIFPTFRKQTCEIKLFVWRKNMPNTVNQMPSVIKILMNIGLFQYYIASFKWCRVFTFASIIIKNQVQIIKIIEATYCKTLSPTLRNKHRQEII